MDHDKARAACERLAESLDAAAEHLVGPGFEFTRRALSNAAGAATALAAAHEEEDDRRADEAERRAAAKRAALGATYVIDLLFPDVRRDRL